VETENWENSIKKKFFVWNTCMIKERPDKCLYILIAFFFLIAVLLALFRHFDHDELEHIHSAWYILQGKTPYLDFFQNHNPTLWFLLAPIILFFGEGTAVLFVSRAIMLLLLTGIAMSVRALSREAGSSTRESHYAVLFVLSCSVLINKSLEVRPDVPQVFFGLLSCLYFLRYLKNKRPLYMVLAGFLAGVSFVMLQKSVLLFAAVGVSMLWLLWRGTVAWRAPLLYAIGNIFPMAGLALYLIYSGCFGDYILTNWVLNMNQLMPFSPLRNLFHSLIENTALWGLVGLSLWTCLFRKRGGPVLQLVSLWGMLLLVCLFLIPRPHNQHLVFPIALLAIPAARQAVWLFERFKCPETCRSRALALALIVPGCVMAANLAESNRLQLKMIRYVLSRTAPDERVYDGDIQFNLYRPDLHYFWFSVKPLKGLDSYNRVSGNRFASYDIHQLIEAKKPVFISDVCVNMDDPLITRTYKNTPFPHLYRLTDAREPVIFLEK
jgi:hypothetical protein